MEGAGPAEFDAARLEFWLHPDQAAGARLKIKGRVIYDHLKDSGLLAGCLGLRELDAIQSRGLPFFWQVLGNPGAVFGWRSCVEYENGLQLAPCLKELDGQLVRLWRPFTQRWGKRSPALRFPL